MIHFQEDFLQVVWKYQYFDKQQLVTTDNTPLSVKKIGFHNFYEGPDFQESLIQLGDLDHAGHVEVHRKSSDWESHSHSGDNRYESVILHVVWENDMQIRRKDGTLLPTLELKGKVLLDVIRNYERLVSAKTDLLCGAELGAVSEIIHFSMLEKSLVERFQEKSVLVHEILKETGNDWEETAYRWLFFSFGFKLNSPVMLKLAAGLPFKLLKKHSDQPVILEAILLGQAGFLEIEALDEYTAFLQREYRFYETKYGLKQTIYPSEWKFMKVRPSNYPIIRLVQLAAIFSKNPHLFSALIRDVTNFQDFKKQFHPQPGIYWQYHYHLGKTSNKKYSRELTLTTMELLAINFLIPLWYAFGQFTDEPAWKEKCFDVLQEISAEKNHIIDRFLKINWAPINAFDSQGMIGLYNNYCSKKKCLECKIGQNLLRPLKK